LHICILDDEHPATRADCIRLLLTHPCIDVNAQDSLMRTPLHLAADNRNTNVLKMLLKHAHIDVNKLANHNYTPLHWAVYNFYPLTVRRLLEHKNIVINYCNTPVTALHLLVTWLYEQDHYLMCARQLMNHESNNVNAMNLRGETALIMAERKDSHHICALLTHG
jgi:ankyrin repeat protein